MRYIMLKKNIFSGLLVALFALTMIGGATAASTKQTDINTINVCVGQEFTITVADCPWIVNSSDLIYDNTDLDYVKMEYTPAQSALCGDFGTRKYTFKAVYVGLTLVKIGGIDYTVNVWPPLNPIDE